MSYIHFYGHTRPYGYFSNFYERSFMVDGKTYSTNEHYFQSKKFEGTPHELIVANADTPSATKRLGGQRSRPLRADWDAVKDDIMFNGVMAKFSQHNDLKQLLLNTGNAILCEHTTRDKYWGDGGDPQWTPTSTIGKNKLGIILMRVRDILSI